MKVRFNTLIVLTVLGVIFSSAVCVYAKGPKGPDLGPIPGEELDESQKAALETQQVEMMKQIILLQAELDVTRLDKQTILKNKNFKSSAVEKLIKKEQDIKTEMEMLRLKNLEAMRNILNDDQWKAFSKHMGPVGPMGHGPMNGPCAMMDKPMMGRDKGPFGPGMNSMPPVPPVEKGEKDADAK